MAPKELTRHQLSGRLQYESRTPAFLHKLKNKIQGGPVEDEDEPQYYDDGSGRPPIPLRPAIPDRPKDDRGSASEDDADELPQVIVLKEGKHLTAREAENERRKAKGLPLLTTSDDESSSKQEDPRQSHKDPPARKTKEKASLSFSSSKEKSNSTSGKMKRKIITGHNESGDENEQMKKARKKKQKREGKGLLSFAEDV
ncbi:hypothetical protein SCLCIDRAFT_1219470 [Scleroderma citrinum Foug A]|uniref:DUF4604 domain-containing protein n=1 Tax=Scleroderma citrinum Foug A TaxID=1036808 RepID=A0A0C2Z5Y0_9AGAM|nr:hypothetical protein SCLCIDRAFT_1219470 [Scleroderma citrinum Foug A]